MDASAQAKRDNEIKKGIFDYARLVEYQLEIMLLREKIRPHSHAEFFSTQRTRDFAEIGRLLHQQGKIKEWLTKPADMDHLPSWECQQSVSASVISDFLSGQQGLSDNGKAREMLRLVVCDDSLAVSPRASIRSPHPHLSLVTPNGAGA